MQFDQAKRREFITLLGVAAAWPLSARAQQPERMRHIAILMLTADDADGQARITALREGLENLGWTEGRNLRVDTSRAAGDTDAGNGRFVTQQTVENR
jgi:putative tryptophan/tyrosine transport system substrate-binding protein